MPSLNKVQLIGHLGADPELKQVGSSEVCEFSLATSEKWTDKSGQKQERTEWHRIKVWGASAKACSQYLAKGRACYVEGKIQTRKWTDKNGQDRYTTEINAKDVQFLGGKDSGGYVPSQASSGAPPMGVDDDLPF